MKVLENKGIEVPYYYNIELTIMYIMLTYVLLIKYIDISFYL